jgi:hypothetical protein
MKNNRFYNVFFEILPFRFEGPAQTKTFNKSKNDAQHQQKNKFFIQKPSKKYLNIEVEKRIPKASKNEANTEPKVIQNGAQIDPKRD